jgi:adenylosuccinate lyase
VQEFKQESVSPLDKRYKQFTAPLINYLSESALNRQRINIEILYLITLCKGGEFNNFEPVIKGLPAIDKGQAEDLKNIVANFDEKEVAKLEAFEKVTNHDVKAVEYYIREKISVLGSFADDEKKKLTNAIHIFATSDDINNLAYAKSIKGAVDCVFIPSLNEFIKLLSAQAREYAAVPMLAKTHGQNATPVTLGKELAVFADRLKKQSEKIEHFEYFGKFNGATGAYAAHTISVPNIDWIAFSKYFIEKVLGLNATLLTTQIESHDYQIELYFIMQHISGILHNFATDIWLYISRGIFTQKSSTNEIGSSTMPHKINPIKFENAEANLELADAIFAQLSKSLVTSRFQRDLSDSSIQRNIASAFGYEMVALENLKAGLKSVQPNLPLLESELENASEVIAEAIQCVMKVAGIEENLKIEDPYEMLKAFTRGKEITLKQLSEFINKTNLPDNAKNKLLNLKPSDYIGLSERLANLYA